MLVALASTTWPFILMTLLWIAVISGAVFLLRFLADTDKSELGL